MLDHSVLHVYAGFAKWFDFTCVCVSHQVIVEKLPRSNINDIDKRKYLVPTDITVAQFLMLIRRRINLPQEKALFMIVGSIVPMYRWV